MRENPQKNEFQMTASFRALVVIVLLLLSLAGALSADHWVGLLVPKL